MTRLRNVVAWLVFVVPILTAGYLVGLCIAIAAVKP